MRLIKFLFLPADFVSPLFDAAQMNTSQTKQDQRLQNLTVSSDFTSNFEVVCDYLTLQLLVNMSGTTNIRWPCIHEKVKGTPPRSAILITVVWPSRAVFAFIRRVLVDLGGQSSINFREDEKKRERTMFSVLGAEARRLMLPGPVQLQPIAKLIKNLKFSEISWLAGRLVRSLVAIFC